MKEEYKKYGTVAIVIVLTLLSILYMVSNKDGEFEIIGGPIEEVVEAEEIDQREEKEETVEIPESIEKVPIYVCGQVKNPDVYYLDQRTIVKVAIEAAGGFTADADQEIWNLAREIQKGDKIYVPKVGEQIDKRDNSYDNREGEAEPSSTSSGLININQANYQELTLLSGIGPVIAQNIIEYREANGEFEKLEDITKVSRIGQGTFDKIKDSICLQ